MLRFDLRWMARRAARVSGTVRDGTAPGQAKEKVDSKAQSSFKQKMQEASAEYQKPPRWVSLEVYSQRASVRRLGG